MVLQKPFLGFLLLAFSLASSLTGCAEAKFGGGSSKGGGGAGDSPGDGSPDGGSPDGGSPDGGSPDGGSPDGGDALPGTGGPTGDPTDSPPGALPKDCVEGDKAKLSFSGKIQECIEQDKLFNFDSNTCTSMQKASFACDFPSVISEVKSLLGRVSAKLEQGRSKGLKLVGCGQSSDRRTIVAQWWNSGKPSPKCEFIQGKTLIVTGCYRLREVGEPAPDTSTKEAQEREVLRCMNSE